MAYWACGDSGSAGNGPPVGAGGADASPDRSGFDAAAGKDADGADGLGTGGTTETGGTGGAGEEGGVDRQEPCPHECTKDSTRCSNARVEKCATTAKGCTTWESSIECKDAPEHGTPLCVDSKCTFECEDGYAPCAEKCCPTRAFQQFSVGSSHACAVAATAGVVCWGAGTLGQLGNNAKEDSASPVDVVGLEAEVTSVGAGAGHSCAVRAGAASCWGRNGYGQLGNGELTGSPTPVAVLGLGSDVVSIIASSEHTCALMKEGKVKCWGRNDYGQLGNDSIQDSLVPVDVVGLQDSVTAVAVGATHTCVLTQSGGVYCWGWNYYGQLGNGSKVISLKPVAVLGLESGVTMIAASPESTHTCALVGTNGTVRCWGSNDAGQLGIGAEVDGSTSEDSSIPVEVVGLSSQASAIGVGTQHSCAALATGGVACWGANAGGQLGDTTTTASSSPVSVVGLTTSVQAIAGGDSHTCALLNPSKRLLCWGANANGQLGNHSQEDSLTPVDVW